MSDESERRTYTKRRRAELEEETRRRIAASAMELHGTVGPARTTVSAVAERAGVRRSTVYRHFPDEAALLAACSAHWAQLNPAPDPSSWAAITDPDERLVAALSDLYAWYRRAEPMLSNVLRDVAFVPALAEGARAMDGLRDHVAGLLAEGRPDAPAVRAAAGHAAAFATWRSLAVDQGLGDDEAVELMRCLLAAAGGC